MHAGGLSAYLIAGIAAHSVLCVPHGKKKSLGCCVLLPALTTAIDTTLAVSLSRLVFAHRLKIAGKVAWAIRHTSTAIDAPTLLDNSTGTA